MTETEKRPFYKKWWFWVVLAVILLFILIPSNKEPKEDDRANDESSKPQSTTGPNNDDENINNDLNENAGIEENEDEVQEEPINKNIDINKSLAFQNFTIELGTVRVYEEDNSIFINLPIKWHNQSFQDKTTFLRAVSMDVKQRDNVLDEVNKAWSDPQSDVYFPNAVGGIWKVDLTYKLNDRNSPVEIVFIAHDEYDENQDLRILIE